jgi:putative oxidoreductase
MPYSARVSAHDDDYKTTPVSPVEDSGRTSLLSDLDGSPGRGAHAVDDRATRWHGGLDFGLLILRLILGATMAAHGLQKLFGAFDGPGIDGFGGALGGVGFTSQTTLLSWITALTELGGGLLLVLGLFTPIGAAAILGIAASIVFVKFGNGFFMGPQQGFEYELMIGAVALALLFTGSGRIALDKNTPWRRKPMPFAILGVLVAAAAAVVVLVVFR